MGTPKKTAGKAEPKAPKAAPAAAPTAAPPADPPAAGPVPSTPSPEANAAAAANSSGEPKLGKWTAHEIVDGETRVVGDTTPVPLQRLERARALLELAGDEKATLMPDGIQSFRDEDGRTMNVVFTADGNVYKQEVNHGK